MRHTFALKSVFALVVAILLVGETLAQEIDGCSTANCNGGVCNPTNLTTGEFNCTCPIGFAQPDCATLICQQDIDCVGITTTCFANNNTCDCSTVENTGDRCEIEPLPVESELPLNSQVASDENVALPTVEVSEEALEEVSEEVSEEVPESQPSLIPSDDADDIGDVIDEVSIDIDELISEEASSVDVEVTQVNPETIVDEFSFDVSEFKTDAVETTTSVNVETIVDEFSFDVSDTDAVETTTSVNVITDETAPISNETSTGSLVAPTESSSSTDAVEPTGVNPCVGQICLNGGRCNSTTGGCDCAPGWTGAICDIGDVTISLDPSSTDEANLCVGKICSNGGQCNATTGGCDCAPGWTGENCDIEDITISLDPSSTDEADLCAGKICLNGGRCNATTGGCDCAPGWTGANCDIGDVTISLDPSSTDGADLCAGQTCLNGGRCNTTTGGCDCAPGWTGAICDIEDVTISLDPSPTDPADPCAGKVCQNGGQCIPSGQCLCTAGWSGVNCEIQDITITIDPSTTEEVTVPTESVDLCAGKDCKNGGTCNVDTGACVCAIGFKGDDCSEEIVVDPCALCTSDEICVNGVCLLPYCRSDSECNTGGVCDIDNGFCLCGEGFEGDNCEVPIVTDPCDSCQAIEICVNQVCIVPNCAAANDCFNGGICDGSTGQCICPENVEGLHCETVIETGPCSQCTENEICVDNACVVPDCFYDADCSNSGTCDNTGKCKCVAGFEGPTCDVVVDLCNGRCNEATQVCVEGTCYEKVQDQINCGTGNEDSVFFCKSQQTVKEDVECCRFADGNCNGLPVCTSDLCCEDPRPVQPSPSVSPMPSPIPQDITCGQKEEEGGLRCSDNGGVETGKVCCRHYGKCGSLQHCTNDFCCKVRPSPKVSPSPVPVCDFAGCREPVDHYISCVTGVYEGHLKCAEGENVKYQEECCRFAGLCGGLKTCNRAQCCTTEATPTPTPTKTPVPPNYRIKCPDKYGLTCYEGYEMKENTQCCRFDGACGDMPYCNKDQCCQLKPNEIPKPSLPEDNVGACWCPGVVMNMACYPTLEFAIANAANGAVIYIANNITVKNPIDFDIDLVFTGVTCEEDRERRAMIISDINSTTLAVLNAINATEQNVRVSYLDVTTNASKPGAFFHGLGVEESAGNQRLGLELTSVRVFNMNSARPGVAVWMGQSAGLNVDPDCAFINNTVATNETRRYAGGAIAVKYLPFRASMTIGGTFENNRASYSDASKGASGGAVWLDWMEGPTMFTAQFINNTANQGGAIMVQEVLGNMVIDGLYENNSAIDDGYGSRAGVFRLWRMHEGSTVLINGTFVNNFAQGRGGIIATNIHEKDSRLTFDGTFQSNIATDVGGVWSRYDETEFEGRVIFDGKSDIEGNRALSDFDQSSLYSIKGSRREKYSEAEWDAHGNQTLYV